MDKDNQNDAGQSNAINRVLQNDASSPQPKTVENDTDKVKPSPPKPKGKKRKSKVQRDVTAPRQPLTGYVRYLNERRDALRAANPRLGFAEVTRRLASDWGRLPAQEKQQYLDAAEQDRERYIREWSAYKETEAYRVFRQQQLDQRKETSTTVGQTASTPKKPRMGNISTHQITNNKTPADANSASNPLESSPPPATANGVSAAIPLLNENQQFHPQPTLQHRLHPLSANSLLTPPAHKTSLTPASVAGALSIQCMAGVQDSGRGASDPNQRETDIPIFTEKFLQHNKLRETELRQLRKANTDYEQQNAILQKHIENMRGAVDKARLDSAGQRSRTSLMRAHLTTLVDTLVRGLANIPIPGGPSGATKQNIEIYMESLRVFASENKNHATVKQAREFLSRMDVPT